MNAIQNQEIVSALTRIAIALERIERKLPEKEAPEKHNNDRPSERFYGYHNCQRD